MRRSIARPEPPRKTAKAPGGLAVMGRLPARLLGAALALGASTQAAVSGQADPLFEGPRLNKFCTYTAEAVQKACVNKVEQDFWLAIGFCANLSDPEERSECLVGTEFDSAAGSERCGARFGARLEACDLVGEQRYEPDFNPADFVDPAEIGRAVPPNPFLPLVPGTRWTYQGTDERITVTVTDQTKPVRGVPCRVVDQVAEREDGAEGSEDWYAQDLDGNVWSCGAAAGSWAGYGAGSWRAFRDFARPGIVMKASPQAGDVYRRAFAPGRAEDAAEIVSVSGSARVPAEGASCAGDCLVVRQFTPLDPDAARIEHYAPGIGLVLVVDLVSRERTQLVELTR